MATYKKIKELAFVGKNVKWGADNDENIWYSVDGVTIWRTMDPEIKSMCMFYAKPQIDVLMIWDIINMEPAMRLNIPELKAKKRGSIYELDRDPKHYIAFPAKAVGEILAMKKDLIFEAHLIGDKPVLVVYERYKDMFFTDLNTIALIMGLRRC